MKLDSAERRTGFFGSFTVLNGAARELWLTFAIKFLIVAAFQVSAVTLVRWLSKDLGMSDQGAQGMVLAWAITMIVVTLLVGALYGATWLGWIIDSQGQPSFWTYAMLEVVGLPTVMTLVFTVTRSLAEPRQRLTQSNQRTGLPRAAQEGA